MRTQEKIFNRDKKISLYFCLVLVLLTSFHCRATDWYASPTGSGNGTLGMPFSLQTALNSASILPGDNLWLRGGGGQPYKGRFICNLNGTPSAKINVASYPGEWAILDGNILPAVNTTNTQVLSVLGGYVRFKDFEITYSNVIRSDTTPNYALCGGIEHTAGEDC